MTRPSRARLDELAQRINAEHDEFKRVGRVALEHAVKCGEALIEAQAQVQHGRWLAWLHENVRVHPTTVYKYMRLARFRDRVLAADATGVEHALRLVADGPWHHRTLPTADDKAEMRRLLESGESMEAIAKSFDVATSTVWRWTSEKSDVAVVHRADSLARRGRAPRHALVEITDGMIEAAAGWLVRRFVDEYSGVVDDRVRGDALQLLGVALQAEEALVV
jgi:Protein of unknown function (DUF3102)/Helix-turn-helix domain of resolvase